MKLTAPTIVIFDMDGTTVRHTNPRLLHVLEWLDDASWRINRFFGWLFMRGARGPVLFDEEQVVKRRKPRLLVHRAMHKLRRKDVEQIVEPCPGIIAVLDFLQKRDIPLALASNGLGKGYGHDVLERFELAGCFRATIFREDITSSKPNPEGILTALRRMDIRLRPDDVIWYIGDRHKDVKAALAAQDHLPCRIVPIAYGVNAAVAALEHNLGPDHIILSYFDMLNTLKTLLSEKRTERQGGGAAPSAPAQAASTQPGAAHTSGPAARAPAPSPVKRAGKNA